MLLLEEVRLGSILFAVLEMILGQMGDADLASGVYGKWLRLS